MIKSSDLSWIVVSDFKKARKFFVEKIGLQESTCSEEFGWLELKGSEGGSTIGIAQKNDKEDMEPGSNAVITLTVDDLEKTRKEFEKKGIKLLGEIMEIPGHVKLQLFADEDGNRFQLVQMLE